MNAFSDYYFLGKITKPHGYEGKVSVYFDTDEPELYSELKIVFININNFPVPYFITYLNINNNKAIVKFKDVDNFDKADFLSKKEMFLPISSLPELTGNNFYYHEIEGFTVVDSVFGTVGKVNEVLDYPNQAVMQIFNGEKEILIPINKHIIVEVNRNKKEIRVQAPEGLIELYLEN
jgi:16S rRNA processing protein RimM